YGIGTTVAGRPAALLAATGILGTVGYRRMARVARPDMLFVAAILVACFLLLRALWTERPAPRLIALAGGVAAVLIAWTGALWLTGHADYLYRVVTQPDVAGADAEPGSVHAYAVAL